MKKTVYCLLPKTAKETYVDSANKQVFMVTAPEKRQIKVQLDKQSFRERFCDTCSLKISEKELDKALTASKIMKTTLNKLSYCNDNNLCTGSNQMLALCPAGHHFSQYETITVDVPELLWLFSWDVTGKEQFKLYAVKEQHDDSFLVTPYLLSNVYTKPLACISWPKNQSRPANLKQAYHTYWESPFSDESWVVSEQTYLNHLISYDPFESEDLKYIRVSDCVKFTDCEGIFYSNDEKILKDIPKRINNLSHVLGTLKQGANNNWLVSINNYLFNKTGKLTGTAKLSLLG